MGVWGEARRVDWSQMAFTGQQTSWKANRMALNCPEISQLQGNLDDVTATPPPHKMDGGQPSTSGCGSGQEDPSAALDQLFLKLHDELPQDTRERFAKLADEVKNLKGAAQTTPPRILPSSDQELAKREEETVETRQSSGELTKGEVVIIYYTHLQHIILAGYRLLIKGPWLSS